MGVASNRKVRSVPPTAPIEVNANDVAHQLANLVQVVSGNLELIAVRTTDQSIARYLDNARTAAQQLTDLTRKLRGEDV